MTRWTVHKFGGTSLAGPAEFHRAAEILHTGDGPRAAVVSASAGVTDRLLSLLRPAGPEPGPVLEGLWAHHEALARELLSEEGAEGYLEAIATDQETIRSVLDALHLLGSTPAEAEALVSGFGESWSARLLARLLREQGYDADWLDARTVLTVAPGALGPIVDWERSTDRLDRALKRAPKDVMVVTGFVASRADGAPTTLGRNGSDFSASIMGALLDAEQVVIWTDVDGVRSADPSRVNESRLISELSYDEAMELAYFGARVLHPGTMAPLVERQIPLVIRNSRTPELEGTRIVGETRPADLVKGVTVIEGMALVSLQGAGMIGVPGTADRLFGALREADISVVLISQGSSEHSICFAVREEEAERAGVVVRRAFSLELSEHQIEGVEVESGCCILAVVGDGMKNRPGVAATLFTALAHGSVNVRAIAQGASERNISAVIASKDATRALRAVHSSFYLSTRTISIGLIGPGSVGGALLDQMAPELERLARETHATLRVRGITNSRHMLLSDGGVPLHDWRPEFEVDGEAADLDRFVDHVDADYLPHAVVIDCSASDVPSARYAEWLERGVHVITANKRASTGPYEYWRAMRESAKAGGARYLYETTAGAGLPILTTIRDLRETGDRIASIEGVLSGTLAYLFNVFDGTVPFSRIVREAREMGYTEPDPRDDLSGMDVARKVVILGREMGLELELDEVEVESLVPGELAEGSIDDFLEGLATFDGAIEARRVESKERGEVLRYVGRLDAEGRASVRLESLALDHPFASIALTDNIVQFRTMRYSENPLIVRGPGAGPDVTAAGVFADLLRLSGYLGAHV